MNSSQFTARCGENCKPYLLHAATGTSNSNPRIMSDIVLHNNTGKPELGSYSAPIFISGPGILRVTKLVNHEEVRNTQGDQYILQFHENNDHSLIVNMRKLRNETVEKSLYPPETANDVVSLQIASDFKTVDVQDGVGNSLIEPCIFSEPIPAFEEIKGSGRRKIELVNFFELVGMMSTWVGCLHSDESQMTGKHSSPSGDNVPEVKKGRLSKDRLLGSFDGKHTSFGCSGVYFGNYCLMEDLNIGFQGSNIHTKMLFQPTNPAKGLEMGPIYLGDGKPYTFMARSMGPDRFTVSIHASNRESTLDPRDHMIKREARLVHGSDDSLASLNLQCVDENRAIVTISKQKKTIMTIELDSIYWNRRTDIISLLPLPKKGLRGTRVYLPGLAPCINILSNAIFNRPYYHLDEEGPALLHKHQPTKRRKHQPKNWALEGAFCSDVIRDYTCVPHYRKNAIVRSGLYAVKRAARSAGNSLIWIRQNPAQALLSIYGFIGLYDLAVNRDEIIGELCRPYNSK